MEHARVREAMSQWYKMWGNTLDIRRVASQTESADAYPIQTVGEVEGKEEAVETDGNEALPASLPLHPPLRRTHNVLRQCDDSACLDCSKEGSQ